MSHIAAVYNMYCFKTTESLVNFIFSMQTVTSKFFNVQEQMHILHYSTLWMTFGI
jgi:hypothetical protein